jgi:hypothetical protein
MSCENAFWNDLAFGRVSPANGEGVAEGLTLESQLMLASSSAHLEWLF